MFVLWKKMWLYFYALEVRAQTKYWERLREELKIAGCEEEMTIQNLNRLHRGIIRHIQIKIAFWASLLSGLAWIISLIYYRLH